MYLTLSARYRNFSLIFMFSRNTIFTYIFAGAERKFQLWTFSTAIEWKSGKIPRRRATTWRLPVLWTRWISWGEFLFFSKIIINIFLFSSLRWLARCFEFRAFRVEKKTHRAYVNLINGQSPNDFFLLFIALFHLLCVSTAASVAEQKKWAMRCKKNLGTVLIKDSTRSRSSSHSVSAFHHKKIMAMAEPKKHRVLLQV